MVMAGDRRERTGGEKEDYCTVSLLRSAMLLDQATMRPTEKRRGGKERHHCTILYNAFGDKLCDLPEGAGD